MRILAFSDLHEEDAALEGLTRISPQYDHVFICGDIARSTLFAESVLDALPNSFVIPGNWDNEAVNATLSSSKQWLHGKRAELAGGLNVVGFGFSPPTPFHTFGEFTEAEIYDGMSTLPIDKDSILLLHCPPKGHFDQARGQHAGSESIGRIIEEKKPFAAIFGHIHEHSGIGMLGSTTLIKLPPANHMRACALTINGRQIKADFIRL